VTPVNGWSVIGPDAELQDKTEVKETTLQVPANSFLDRKSLEEVRFRVTKYFSRVRLGFLKVGEPDPDQIEVYEKDLFYIPFWRAVGSYACRYLRRSVYSAGIANDVEEVMINGESQQIATERRRISDVVSEIASSSAIPTGIGPVPLTPFQGNIRAGLQKGFSSGIRVALRSKDKEVSHKVQLTIEAEEIASYAVKSEVCFNAHLGKEDQKTLKALRSVTRFDEATSDVVSKGLSIHFSKEDLISRLKGAIVKQPEIRPHRIIEQVAVASKIELIYVPCYRFIAGSKGGDQRVIEFNALTNEDYVSTQSF